MNQKTAGSKIAEISSKIVGLIEPLSSEDRHKVIRASLTMVGEHAQDGAGAGILGTNSTGGDVARSNLGSGSFKPKAANWMKQNGISKDQIDLVLDIPSGEIIASVPGNSKREKTLNACVLEGISRLFTTGEAAFDDKDARKLCQDQGCFDRPNHAAIMNSKGNILTGSKDNGWKLTSPGLARAAELVKEISKGQ